MLQKYATNPQRSERIQFNHTDLHPYWKLHPCFCRGTIISCIISTPLSRELTLPCSCLAQCSWDGKGHGNPMCNHDPSRAATLSTSSSTALRKNRFNSLSNPCTERSMIYSIHNIVTTIALVTGASASCKHDNCYRAIESYQSSTAPKFCETYLATTSASAVCGLASCSPHVCSLQQSPCARFKPELTLPTAHL